MFFRFSSLPAFVWGNTTSCNYFVNCYITPRFHRGARISLFPFSGEGGRLPVGGLAHGEREILNGV